jgi:alpha-1,3-rhamnosyl/mannosyltransferase
MNVTLVVDALGPSLSGIGRYALELCKRIPRQPGIDRVRYFRNGRFVDDPATLLAGKEPPNRRFPRWLDSRMSRRRIELSLVHAPNYFLPLEAERGIVTIHDLSVFRFPETHPVDRLRAFERDFDDSLRRAVHVITDTATVRAEILDRFGLPDDRVSAIPLGVEASYRPRSDEELQPLLRQWKLEPRGYALCVSALEPRKKIGQLLAAWRDLPHALRGQFPLVLAGPPGWLNDDLQEAIAAGSAEGWLRHLGFVPEADLPALYAGAALFLYPSIYEGFGLPPLEAMASGVPVVVSGASCLAEVCGEAAAYVQPDDIAGFRDRIAAALQDGDWQSSARDKGLKRAALFDWESCATRTARLYVEHGPRPNGDDGFVGAFTTHAARLERSTGEPAC